MDKLARFVFTRARNYESIITNTPSSHSMKSPILSALLFLVASTVASLGSAKWHKTIEEAIAVAQTKNLPVLVEFTGSDWCPPCKAIAKEVFDTPEFAEFANGKVVLVKLDFLRKSPQAEIEKTYNNAQAKKYDLEAFPTMILLTHQGKEVARTTGFGGKKSFMDWLDGSIKKAK